MEIRYQIPRAEFAKIFKLISRQVYKGNKKVKYLGLLDLALFVPYLALIVILFVKSREWLEFFNCWYDNNYAVWIRWILLIGIYVIFIYVTSVRPRLVNNIVRAQVIDSQLDKEHIVRIQQDGLYAQSALAQTLYAYSQIPQVKNLKQYLVIFIGSGHFIAVPHKAFKDENQRLEFENLLRAKLEDKPD